ncbi:MAG: ATP synthase F1 subunit epsilon [Clostridiales Family XIII bacterium]|jgi:F-type H+-transporting ATPase subunit epsilon|nr:ATP synthase F1 subunit epsilon [Clostridiales Family XIII bacterium]
MANVYMLEIVTPNQLFYSGEVEMVIVETVTGQEGFMAGHSWATKLLKSGVCYIREKGEKELRTIALSDGFIDVKKTVLIYADAAEWAEEIDIHRAEAAYERYSNWLESHDTSNATKAEEEERRVLRAKAGLSRAMSRLKVAGKVK